MRLEENKTDLLKFKALYRPKDECEIVLYYMDRRHGRFPNCSLRAAATNIDSSNIGR